GVRGGAPVSFRQGGTAPLRARRPGPGPQAPAHRRTPARAAPRQRLNRLLHRGLAQVGGAPGSGPAELPPAVASPPPWPSPLVWAANTGSARTTSGGSPSPSSLAGFTASHTSSSGQLAANCAIEMRTAVEASPPAAR